MKNMSGKIRVAIVAAACLMLASRVHAQTHVCDATPVVTFSTTTASPVQFTICQDGKDTNGNAVTLTGVAMYVDGARSTPAFAKGTTSTVSGKTAYTVNYTAPTTAGVRTIQFAPIGPGTPPEGAKQTVPFVLTVTLPQTAPTAFIGALIQ